MLYSVSLIYIFFIIFFFFSFFLGRGWGEFRVQGFQGLGFSVEGFGFKQGQGFGD